MPAGMGGTSATRSVRDLEGGRADQRLKGRVEGIVGRLRGIDFDVYEYETRHL